MSEETLREIEEEIEDEIEEEIEEELPAKSYIQYSYYFGDLDTNDVEKLYTNVPYMRCFEFKQPDISEIHIKGYISVFNDILEEISVMKCVMNEIPEDDWNYLIQYQTLTERYSKLNEKFYDNSNNKNILRHLCIIYNIFYTGFLEFIDNQTLYVFINAVHDYVRLIHDEALLLDELAANKQKLLEIKQAIVKEKKLLLEVIAKSNYKLFKAKEYVEDIGAYAKMENTYTRAWENARVEQKVQDLKDKENYYRNIKVNMELKTQQENRVHGEIELYTNEKMLDIRNEIEFWMEQYDTESEGRDIDMGKLRVEIELQKDKLETLKNEYELRANFIKERQTIKEKRREAEALRRRQLVATMRIQAWWRGVMVRRFLGKYKKLKKRLKKARKARKAAAKAAALKAKKKK